MRIAFLGTPDFAVPSLEMLSASGHELAVFTQPDRPAGRGNKLLPPAVKVVALKLNIPVFQFEKIKSEQGVSALAAFAPQLMVTAAFGQLLSKQILEIPQMGCINVHASLLPAYRGAAPIQWAVINGEKRTGITTMFTDIGLDTGDILLSQTVDILPDETAGQLFDRLAPVGAQVLKSTIEQLQNGSLKRTPQDNARASYYPMIKKADALIDFSKPAESIACFVRGMNPWPMAYTVLAEGTVKICKAQAVNGCGKPGTVLEADSKEGLVIACGQGAIKADVIQCAGSRAMTAQEYLRGHSITKGQLVNDGFTV